MSREQRTQKIKKAAFGGGTLFLIVGAIAAFINHLHENKCRIGDYILQNAYKFSCTATGGPCDYDEGPDNMRIETHCANATKDAELWQDASNYGETLGWSVEDQWVMGIAPAAGLIGGALLFSLLAWACTRPRVGERQTLLAGNSDVSNPTANEEQAQEQEQSVGVKHSP
jgi:hypothetical protein